MDFVYYQNLAAKGKELPGNIAQSCAGYKNMVGRKLEAIFRILEVAKIVLQNQCGLSHPFCPHNAQATGIPVDLIKQKTLKP